MQRHKVFVSYHHDRDQAYKDDFERLFHAQNGVIISRSVQIGDIDPNNNTEYTRQIIRDNYLRDSTVTVVLIGPETWKRKHVDWEIYSSLRDTQYNPRSGLLGIILPSYPGYRQKSYDERTIPQRLAHNLKSPFFASIHYWTTDPQAIAAWIHEAFLRRTTILPNNNMPMFGKNQSGDRW